MPSLAKNKSKSLKPKKVALKNGHKNGHKNGIKVSAKTAILKKAGKVAKRTFFFGGGKAEGTKEMKNLLGGKGANLAEMANIGLPVPPGFTITTEVCTEFYAGGKKLPKALGRRHPRRDRARWRSWSARSSATRRTRCWSRCARARARRCPA